MRRLLREPLLQFLLLGTGIFLATQFVEHRRETAARTVVVEPARVERVAELYRVQMGSPPSAAELQHLVEGYIRDEILYREALNIGLDRDDEIIRRRLVQKMEFLSSDLADVPEPSEGALRRYYEQHAGQFSIAGTVTFTHVYFSADSRGEAAARRSAEALLANACPNADTIAADDGDPFPLQYAYSEVSRTEAAQVFGRTPFVDALFSAPPERWSGPVRSGYGWHLILVVKRTPEAIAPFASVRAQVRDAYIEQQKRAANEDRYEAFRATYTVLRPSVGERPE